MKGIYVLIINVNQTICSRIGALGLLTFQAGQYAYVGSAQTNIESRVARHQKKEKPLFWHIDYLLSNEATKVLDIYYIDGPKTRECQVANLILLNAGNPIPAFGSSDCNCISHLFYAQDFQFLKQHMQSL
jgi:Uri superfamily endonuclease